MVRCTFIDPDVARLSQNLANERLYLTSGQADHRMNRSREAIRFQFNAAMQKRMWWIG
jgi:hypothetical protein